ncbi:MAG TPA: hypothetical protein VNN10_04920, partial [Dehalococcoidia bacterium]|nr:hypothetical protein [Dehalococcoidia bacterium]
MPRKYILLLLLCAAALFLAACGEGDGDARSLPTQLRPTSTAVPQGAAVAQAAPTAPAALSGPARATCGSGGGGIGGIQRTGQR